MHKIIFVEIMVSINKLIKKSDKISINGEVVYSTVKDQNSIGGDHNTIRYSYLIKISPQSRVQFRNIPDYGVFKSLNLNDYYDESNVSHVSFNGQIDKTGIANVIKINNLSLLYKEKEEKNVASRI